MKLKSHGKSTLKAEVTQISLQGIWVLTKDTEYFLSYQDFPWFKGATAAQIHHVQLLHGFHLRWPDIDVDLHLDSLKDTDKSSLVHV